MSEEHTIVGPARGEPLSAGRVGARLRFRLSGSPSARWSHDLSARLTRELAGHAAIGHLRLNEIVQGRDIVLDGVESRESPNIAGALERAVDATNAACVDTTGGDPRENMPPAEADAIADAVRIGQRGGHGP